MCHNTVQFSPTPNTCHLTVIFPHREQYELWQMGDDDGFFIDFLGVITVDCKLPQMETLEFGLFDGSRGILMRFLRDSPRLRKRKVGIILSNYERLGFIGH